MIPTTFLSQKARAVLRALLTYLLNIPAGQAARLTYTDVEQRTGIFRRHLEPAAWRDRLTGVTAMASPPINALVVSKASGHPGSGFRDHARM